MRIIPLAAESMGVRSMATYVDTGDMKIVIDPGAALCPKRNGYPPSEIELKELENRKKLISKYARRSAILIVSHYHMDHHDPPNRFHKGKYILMKDPDKDINPSQKKRGRDFRELHNLHSKMNVADGTSVDIKNTRISFSKPLPHGIPGTKMGYVIMTTIDTGYRFMHSSDVQGPVSKKATREIIRQNPDLLMLDGPPTYLLGSQVTMTELSRAASNILDIIKHIDCEIILDHHLLRDVHYKKRLAKVYSKGVLRTAAEYIGEKNNLLEANRKDIYEGRT